MGKFNVGDKVFYRGISNRFDVWHNLWGVFEVTRSGKTYSIWEVDNHWNHKDRVYSGDLTLYEEGAWTEIQELQGAAEVYYGKAKTALDAAGKIAKEGVGSVLDIKI